MFSVLDELQVAFEVIELFHLVILPPRLARLGLSSPLRLLQTFHLIIASAEDVVRILGNVVPHWSFIYYFIS
jgi:hypothetical protein